MAGHWSVPGQGERISSRRVLRLREVSERNTAGLFLVSGWCKFLITLLGWKRAVKYALLTHLYLHIEKPLYQTASASALLCRCVRACVGGCRERIWVTKGAWSTLGAWEGKLNVFKPSSGC